MTWVIALAATALVTMLGAAGATLAWIMLSALYEVTKQ